MQQPGHSGIDIASLKSLKLDKDGYYKHLIKIKANPKTLPYQTDEDTGLPLFTSAAFTGLRSLLDALIMLVQFDSEAIEPEQVLEQLLESTEPCSGATALQKACEGGQLSTVEALLEAGAKITSIDNRGRTAFHYVVMGKQSGTIYEVREKILSKLYGKYAEHLRLNGHAEEAAVPFHLIPDKDGYTPLLLCLKLNSKREGGGKLADLLISKYTGPITEKVAPHASEYPGATALHLAAMSGQHVQLRNILHSGVSLSTESRLANVQSPWVEFLFSKDQDNRTPLNYAEDNKDDVAKNILLSAELDQSAIANTAGQSPRRNRAGSAASPVTPQSPRALGRQLSSNKIDIPDTFSGAGNKQQGSPTTARQPESPRKKLTIPGAFASQTIDTSGAGIANDNSGIPQSPRSRFGSGSSAQQSANPVSAQSAYKDIPDSPRGPAIPKLTSARDAKKNIPSDTPTQKLNDAPTASVAPSSPKRANELPRLGETQSPRRPGPVIQSSLNQNSEVNTKKDLPPVATTQKQNDASSASVAPSSPKRANESPRIGANRSARVPAIQPVTSHTSEADTKQDLPLDASRRQNAASPVSMSASTRPSESPRKGKIESPRVAFAQSDANQTGRSDTRKDFPPTALDHNATDAKSVQITDAEINSLANYFAEKQSAWLAEKSRIITDKKNSSPIEQVTPHFLELVKLIFGSATPVSIEVNGSKKLLTKSHFILLLNALPTLATSNSSNRGIFDNNSVVEAICEVLSTEQLIEMVKAIIHAEVVRDLAAGGSSEKRPTLFRADSLAYKLLYRISLFGHNNYVVKAYEKAKGKGVKKILNLLKKKDDENSIKIFLQTLLTEKCISPMQSFILCALYHELSGQGVSSVNAIHRKVAGFYNNRFVSGALMRAFGLILEKNQKSKSAQENLQDAKTFTILLSNSLSKCELVPDTSTNSEQASDTQSNLELARIWANICNGICRGYTLIERERVAKEVLLKEKHSNPQQEKPNTQIQQALVNELPKAFSTNMIAPLKFPSEFSSSDNSSETLTGRSITESLSPRSISSDNTGDFYFTDELEVLNEGIVGLDNQREVDEGESVDSEEEKGYRKNMEETLHREDMASHRKEMNEMEEAQRRKEEGRLKEIEAAKRIEMEEDRIRKEEEQLKIEEAQLREMEESLRRKAEAQRKQLEDERRKEEARLKEIKDRERKELEDIQLKENEAAQRKALEVAQRKQIEEQEAEIRKIEETQRIEEEARLKQIEDAQSKKAEAQRKELEDTQHSEAEVLRIKNLSATTSDLTQGDNANAAPHSGSDISGLERVARPEPETESESDSKPGVFSWLSENVVKPVINHVKRHPTPYLVLTLGVATTATMACIMYAPFAAPWSAKIAAWAATSLYALHIGTGVAATTQLATLVPAFGLGALSATLASAYAITYGIACGVGSLYKKYFGKNSVNKLPDPVESDKEDKKETPTVATAPDLNPNIAPVSAARSSLDPLGTVSAASAPSLSVWDKKPKASRGCDICSFFSREKNEDLPRYFSGSIVPISCENPTHESPSPTPPGTLRHGANA